MNMNSMAILLTVLISLMVIGAIAALETKNMFAAVLSWAGACLTLSAIFVMLNALDLAVVQLAVEIIVVVLLLRATASLGTETPRERSVLSALPRYLTALLMAAGFFILCYFALKDLPPFGLPLFKAAQTVLNNGSQTTGFTNLAGAVFLRIRSLDVFAAAALFFAAVLGAMSLLRGKGHK